MWLSEFNINFVQYKHFIRQFTTCIKNRRYYTVEEYLECTPDPFFNGFLVVKKSRLKI